VVAVVFGALVVLWEMGGDASVLCRWLTGLNELDDGIEWILAKGMGLKEVSRREEVACFKTIRAFICDSAFLALRVCFERT